MAEGDITIRIPGGSPPIPEVVLNCFPKGEDHYEITPNGLAEVVGRSAVGTAEINGTLKKWNDTTILAALPEDDALALEAMAIWSSAQYESGSDGHLEMDWELEYIAPEPSPHSRTLVSTLTTSYGYEYGYPRYDIGLILPAGFRKRIGNVSGTIYSLVQFAVREV